ncbi:unnamed protein product, partial [Lymnaea stagnalis]
SEILFRLLKPDDDGMRTVVRSRPAPADDTPAGSLIEEPSRLHDPPAVDVHTLQKLLGHAYDKEYMSHTDPTRAPAQKSFPTLVNGRTKGQRPSYLKLVRRARLQDGSRLRLHVSKKSIRKIENYIWAVTSCPVMHTWKNLGRRFWPQWIKEGRCSKKISCSIPSGMHCNPSATTYKTILRWQCQDFVRKTQCDWIHIKYPVITACACSC